MLAAVMAAALGLGGCMAGDGKRKKMKTRGGSALAFL